MSCLGRLYTFNRTPKGVLKFESTVRNHQFYFRGIKMMSTNKDCMRGSVPMTPDERRTSILGSRPWSLCWGPDDGRSMILDAGGYLVCHLTGSQGAGMQANGLDRATAVLLVEGANALDGDGEPVWTDAEIDTLYAEYIDDREPSGHPLVCLGRLDVSRAPDGGGDEFGGLLRVIGVLACVVGLLLIAWGVSL